MDNIIPILFKNKCKEIPWMLAPKMPYMFVEGPMRKDLKWIKKKNQNDVLKPPERAKLSI